MEERKLAQIEQDLRAFFDLEGFKYQSPQKAGDEEALMLEMKALGRQARSAFKYLVERLDQLDLGLFPVRVSNWMNQAQVIRPAFYAYFRPLEASQSLPAMALRLYRQGQAIGISWEVSVLERKKDPASYDRLHRHLQKPAPATMSYKVFYQEEARIDWLSHGERDQNLLQAQLKNGQISRIWLVAPIGLLKDFEDTETWLKKAQAIYWDLYPYYLLTCD
ncbi:TPA: hypothetical protein ACGO1T_001614 [Streptococcus suis]